MKLITFLPLLFCFASCGVLERVSDALEQADQSVSASRDVVDIARDVAQDALTRAGTVVSEVREVHEQAKAAAQTPDGDTDMLTYLLGILGVGGAGGGLLKMMGSERKKTETEGQVAHARIDKAKDVVSKQDERIRQLELGAARNEGAGDGRAAS